MNSKELGELRQNESAWLRRSIAGAVLAILAHSLQGAYAQGLDAGGLSFRDFGNADNGASYSRGNATGPHGETTNLPTARLLGVDAENGLARVRFEAIKVEVALPLGWQAFEDWERGTAFSEDRKYRVIVWRVDFAFEGVLNAEQYAATKAGTIKARRPGIQTDVRKLPDGTFLIAYSNVTDDGRRQGELRSVFDLVVPKPSDSKAGVLVTLGVPQADSERGLKLLSLLRNRIVIQW